MQRISGPLLDRFDMRIEMTRVPPEQLLGRKPGEPSALVAGRIAAARAIALARNGGLPNALLEGVALARACALRPRDKAELTRLATGSVLTARGVHRVLRVARSMADLEGRAVVHADDLMAALRLREPGSPPAAQAA